MNTETIAQRLAAWQHFFNTGVDTSPADAGVDWSLDWLTLEAYASKDIELARLADAFDDLAELAILKQSNELHAVLMSDPNLVETSGRFNAAALLQPVTVADIDAALMGCKN